VCYLIEHYQHSSNDLPKKHYYNRFVKDFRHWTMKYVDFMHFTVPLVTGQSDGFQFPSEFVGQYGAYEALKHICLKSKTLSENVKDDSIFLSKDYSGVELEKSIQSIRKDFRATHNIPAEGTCIFLAPGNEKNECEFSMASCHKGIHEFLLKYSYPTSLSAKAPPLSNYTTIISVQRGTEGEAFVK
jgi:hypothetical protein